MSKTRFASVAAIAAGLAITLASAEISGAVAQSDDAIEQPAEAELTDETMPVFVAEEVVQPLPEETEATNDIQDQSESRPASLRALVAETRVPDSLSAEMECLAGAVYFESRGEPLAGQLAVAQVVINRTDSRTFPSSYCGVVYQRAQFSFVKNGHMPRIKRGSGAWQRAKKIARIAHEGLWESEAADSLYFHATYVNPRWNRNMQTRARIQTHIFYR